MASKTYVSIREGNAPLTLSVNVDGGMYHARFDPYFTTSNTEIQQASAIINRIREAIEADQTSGVKVTMSFGLAPLQKITNSIEGICKNECRILIMSAPYWWHS